MRYCRQILLLVTLLLSAQGATAQMSVPMGQWRTHFAYNNTRLLAVSNSEVYALSGGVLYSIDKNEESITTYSKINGLSDNGICLIKYFDERNLLLIAYENGNLDLYYDNRDEIVNINDILKKNIVASKSVNDAIMHENFLYLALPFGIVKVNLDKDEIADTYYMQAENDEYYDIKSLTVMDSEFWAVSEDAIFQAKTSGVNLANFQNWKVMLGVPTGKNQSALAIGENLYLLKQNGKLYDFYGNSWLVADNGVVNISEYKGVLAISKNNSVKIPEKSIDIPIEPAMAVCDRNAGALWVAGKQDGIFAVDLADNTRTNSYKPFGPAIDEIWRMRWSGERMFAVQGGRWAVPFGITGRVMILDGFHWKEVTPAELSVFPYDQPHDFMDIAIDPNDNTHFWIASSGTGILEFKQDKPCLDFNWTSAQIDNQVENAVFDQQGSLWIANPKSQYYIKRIDYNQGSYAVTPIANVNPAGVYATSELIIDPIQSKYKYLVMARGDTKVVVLDDNNTPETSDDRLAVLSQFRDQDGKPFSADFFLSADYDRESGALWVGTNSGPVILPKPKRAFDNPDYRVQRIKISRNDGTSYADYLLENEVINALAIDGNNRKWLGTESSGVYLLSSDGTQEIYHFTQDNSPLLSNFIRNISINHSTGEVFFATNKGLISFQADATEPQESYSSLHAFPNPVRPDYDGDITIKGLADGSVVKILDTRGNVVFETYVRGGSAVWQGRQSNGQRVASGVYTAVCITADKSKHSTVKILIVR